MMRLWVVGCGRWLPAFTTHESRKSAIHRHIQRANMLRILLFVGTNLAIMLVLGVVVSLFGLDRWAYSHTGMNLQGLLVLCAVFGMGGSFISLAMSKTLATSESHASWNPQKFPIARRTHA